MLFLVFFFFFFFFSRPTFSISSHSFNSSLCSGTLWHHPKASPQLSKPWPPCHIHQRNFLFGSPCHAPPQFDLTELRHACTHLMTDRDLIQSRHRHTGQHRTVSNPAISDISGHLRTGRDSMLTACTPHSATFSSTYF